MEYAVVSPAWDTEGKFFVIDASKKEQIIISENNSATYAEALPETEAEILMLFQQYDATQGLQQLDKYIFTPATEDWYLAEAELK